MLFAYRRPLTLLTTTLLAAGLYCDLPQARAQDYACAVPAHVPPEALPQREDPRREELQRFSTGAGVRVAVIDTGVAAHPELDQLIAGRDFVDRDAPDALVDCDSHGTIVAGIIGGTTRGIAPDAEIISVRQTSAHYRNRSNDETTEFAGSLQSLADAIHNSLDEGARVINISVVSCLPPEIAPRVDMSVVDHALGRAEAEGAVVVAAAGNASDSCQNGFTVVPAHSPTVIAVGARMSTHDMAEYSIAAPDPSVSAEGMVSLALSSDGNGWASGSYGGSGDIRPYVGTSFAAPRVSGAIALLRSRYPHLTPQEIRELVYAAAQPGGGAIDAQALIAQLPPDEVPVTAPVIIEPELHRESEAPARWLLLAGVALVLLGAVAVGRSFTSTSASMPTSTSPSAQRRG